jgi:hypothetical protein
MHREHSSFKLVHNMYAIDWVSEAFMLTTILCLRESWSDFSLDHVSSFSKNALSMKDWCTLENTDGVAKNDLVVKWLVGS